MKIEKGWYYVTPKDYLKLLEAAPNLNWRLLISISRLAGLRVGETLNLEWDDIDWNRNCLKIKAKERWQPKDKDPKTPPICHELQQLLLRAYEVAEPKQKRVLGKMCKTNLYRDFGVICKRAGVRKYVRPFQTLRKNCYEDWARHHPAHVVKEWAGHSSLDVTDKYYLQVSEAEYKQAAERSFLQNFAQLFAQLDQNKGIDKNMVNRIDLSEKNIRKYMRA